MGRDIEVYNLAIDWMLSHPNIPKFNLDVGWIPPQPNVPEFIHYIACLRFTDRTQKNKKCDQCKTRYPFGVKVINGNGNDYKVISIGCTCGHNRNTEYIECERCGSDHTPLRVMWTNWLNTNICKSCDIECLENVYRCVPYREKDEAKYLGANWDSKYKKRYINNNNKNMKMVIEKWKISFESANMVIGKKHYGSFDRISFN